MNFKEYAINEEVNEELLQEDVLTAIGAFFGISIGISILIWGGSLIVSAYAKTISKIFKKTIRVWKETFEAIGIKFNKKNSKEIYINQKKDQRVKSQVKKTDALKKKYEKELSDVFEALENKNWQKASTLLNEKKKIKNTPEVRRLIVSITTEILEEPPMYVKNSVNNCYKAIKQVYDIKTARYAAELVKRTLKKSADDLDLTEEN